jgi:hypothetical protein
MGKNEKAPKLFAGLTLREQYLEDEWAHLIWDDISQTGYYQLINSDTRALHTLFGLAIGSQYRMGSFQISLQGNFSSLGFGYKHEDLVQRTQLTSSGPIETVESSEFGWKFDHLGELYQSRHLLYSIEVKLGYQLK